METVIKKAIDGGWIVKGAIGYKGTKGDAGSTHIPETLYYAFLDPLFWQALGKACGWGTIHDEGCDSQKDYCTHPNKKCTCEQCDCYTQFEWKENALRFHEINLTQGFDFAIKYLSDLTTS